MRYVRIVDDANGVGAGTTTSGFDLDAITLVDCTYPIVETPSTDLEDGSGSSDPPATDDADGDAASSDDTSQDGNDADGDAASSDDTSQDGNDADDNSDGDAEVDDEFPDGEQDGPLVGATSGSGYSTGGSSSRNVARRGTPRGSGGGSSTSGPSTDTETGAGDSPEGTPNADDQDSPNPEAVVGYASDEAGREEPSPRHRRRQLPRVAGDGGRSRGMHGGLYASVRRSRYLFTNAKQEGVGPRRSVGPQPPATARSV